MVAENKKTTICLLITTQGETLGSYQLGKPLIGDHFKWTA